MRLLTPLALVTMLVVSGCGTTPAGARSAPGGAVAARSFATEVVPSEAELARTAANSPDELVDNPAPEPGTQGWWPAPPKDDLGNFGKVDDTLWRGARPTDKGLEQLAAMGVRTIVNFENDKKVVEHERDWAAAHGIAFHSIALSVITPPKKAKIDQWLALAEDGANRPLYFHCMQGRDRTGVAAYTYRLHHDGWAHKQSYAEMKSYKFHTFLLGIQGFLLWYAHNNKPATQPAFAQN